MWYKDRWKGALHIVQNNKAKSQTHSESSESLCTNNFG